MSDIYVIYWSGTGNTEMMAGAVAEGIHAVATQTFLTLQVHPQMY